MTTGKTVLKRKPLVLVDIGALLPKSARNTDAIRSELSDAKRNAEQLRKIVDKLKETLGELESRDRLGNFEIQQLMSDFNLLEATTSTALRRRDGIAGSILKKI